MRAGFVLPASLVLLLALTLVATGAMRASGLESQMAGNASAKVEAFESSETVRRLFEPVLHAALDGDAAALQAASASGWTLTEPTGAALATNDDESGNCATPFVKADGAPCTLRIDATFERNVADAAQPASLLRGQVAVFRVRAAPAASEGESYFYVECRAEGTGDAPDATSVVTAAIVRHVAGSASPAGETSALAPEPRSRNGEIDWRERRG